MKQSKFGLQVTEKPDNWRLGYVEMSKGVTVAIHFGPATLIPGQSSTAFSITLS